MNSLIGNTDAVGHPGLGLNSRAVNLMKKNTFINSVSGINNHFTDSGLFGLNIQGAGSHSHDLMNIGLEELSRLK